MAISESDINRVSRKNQGREKEYPRGEETVLKNSMGGFQI